MVGGTFCPHYANSFIAFLFPRLLLSEGVLAKIGLGPTHSTHSFRRSRKTPRGSRLYRLRRRTTRSTAHFSTASTSPATVAAAATNSTTTATPQSLPTTQFDSPITAPTISLPPSNVILPSPPTVRHASPTATSVDVSRSTSFDGYLSTADAGEKLDDPFELLNSTHDNSRPVIGLNIFRA